MASHFYNAAEESDIWNKWEAAPLPAGLIARETSPWAWAFAINSKSTSKDAAWLFIQWATSEQTAALLSTGGSPPNKVCGTKLFINKLALIKPCYGCLSMQRLIAFRLAW